MTRYTDEFGPNVQNILIQATRVVRGRIPRQTRAYVSGRRFTTFATAAGAIAWRDNVEKLAPQPWDAFRN